MFIHNFKYSFKILFKDKMLIFWTFAFPIILGTFFSLTFSDIENNEKLGIINIAIVDNQEFQENEIFKEAFREISDPENEDRLFETKYVNEEEAKDLLDKKDITGYLALKSGVLQVTVASNGINETVLKYVAEEISRSSDIVDNLAAEEIEKEIASGNYSVNYEEIYKNIWEKTQLQEVKLKNISGGNLSYTMIEFYTLIAMTCLYGGILGTVAINRNLANMSSNGKRVAVSPVSKGKMITASVLASYITQLVGIALLFVYTVFVLKVDYGDNLPLIILLALAGCFCGLSLGIAVGTLIKSNENLKTGIIISVTMLGCFLSGMMGITMKYVVDKNIPVINKLNPASMITDGLYSLYYYDTLDRYLLNLASLIIFAFIMIFISYIGLRRQKYDSV